MAKNIYFEISVLKKAILDESDAPALACSSHLHISECGLKS